MMQFQTQLGHMQVHRICALRSAVTYFVHARAFLEDAYISILRALRTHIHNYFSLARTPAEVEKQFCCLLQRKIIK
jgi:hypothetical protein